MMRKYVAIRDRLAERIRTQGVGDPLPSERDLARDWGVSRMTVRQAVDELAREGRVERIVGKGTFVARPVITLPLTLTSFSEDMRNRGYQPSSRILQVRARLLTPDEQASLGFADPSVISLRRLRLANGEPMALETSLLRAERVPGITEFDFATNSLYDVLLTHYAISLEHGEQVIRADLAGPEDAALLGVPAGAPVMRMTRRSAFDGALFEVAQSVYRGDRYELSATLARTAG